jgi:hypothetical protein
MAEGLIGREQQGSAFIAGGCRVVNRAAQASHRQQRNVDAPERLRRGLNRVNDRRTDNGRVRDNDRQMVLAILAGEPVCNPPHEAEDRFPTVRCCRRVAQARGDAFWIARTIEAAPCPKSIFAVVQGRLHVRAELQHLRGLARPQLRTGPAAVGARQMRVPLRASRRCCRAARRREKRSYARRRLTRDRPG